jgi:prolyl-tRNA synthetase
MSGSYTLLPLGRRVERKIEQVIREEMNKTGAQEVLMPLLHPKEIWNETGRWETAKEVMYQFEKDEREYALSFTHEEIVMDLIRKHVSSYKDFPVKIYHFSTKFRAELRAKSGILRGREFLMKDLYSAHINQEDLNKYYWEVADAYLRTFKRLGLNVKIVEAAGGVFTENVTHEFQQFAQTGEDLIYYCPSCDFAQNDEIAKVKEGDTCPKCGKEKIVTSKSIEVGNIFPLGTKYSEKMNAYFTDKDGSRKPIWFASYGIGPTRVMGTLVEVHHDEKGIIWPEAVAPYAVHLIGLTNDNSEIKEKVESIYKKLIDAEVEVLYDDRESVGPGEKFADADLIGIPVRLVVSTKTGDKVEWKKRNEKTIELLDIDSILKRLKTE